MGAGVHVYIVIPVESCEFTNAHVRREMREWPISFNLGLKVAHGLPPTGQPFTGLYPIKTRFGRDGIGPVVQCRRPSAVVSDDKLQTESIYVAPGIESGRAEAHRNADWAEADSGISP
ncbi:hypothetical protein LA080_000716 [Diaporthe eres]|nr:hypothetical protein LA080_000716 [Diaporthe eres]